MTFSFRRLPTKGMVEEFNIEEDGTHVCKVFTARDAIRICEAMNVKNAALMVKFVTSLQDVGLGDPRRAEILLANIRVRARQLTVPEKVSV